MAHLQYLPGDPRLVDQLVYELKSKGIFDQFRKECIADVDTRPAYQNLRQRVENSVSSFLSRQTWKPDMNKNQLREKLRKHILDGNYLEQGVERIVDQVVNPKVASVFIPQVEELVCEYLGIARKKSTVADSSNEKPSVEDLLPTDLEAVSPGSVHDEKEDVKIENDEVKMEVDIDESKSELKESTNISLDIDKMEDTQLSGISELTIHDANSIDKSMIPLPAEEIKPENIPPPENSPPKDSPQKGDVELENIELPKEPNLSTDIPLPDEITASQKDQYFKPMSLNSEEDESSSDSSLIRNMSPLTPIRNFNNENSCDAQQAFENTSVENKEEERVEPSSFRFTIEAKSSENSSESVKIENKNSEQASLQYPFKNEVNINTFNTPLYEDSSNSNNLQIDYESDANSKMNVEFKAPDTTDHISEDFKKDQTQEEKKNSQKSIHRSRDSHRHSSSKDRTSKHSSSRDKKDSNSKQDRKSEKDDNGRSKSGPREQSHDRSDKKDSRDSSKHRSSHKSSSHKEKDSKSYKSSGSSQKYSNKSEEKKYSSSKEKDKSSNKEKERISDKEKDKKSEKSQEKEKSSERPRSSKDSKSSRSDKDKKSSSKSKHDDKDKKEKKDTDDHYSASGRGNNHHRRSTDRDSNDGSSSSKGSHNPSHSKSNNMESKEKGSGSKFEKTSTSGGSSSPSDKDIIKNEAKNAEDLQANRIVRVDNRLETPVCTPPKLPVLPDIILKKPRFAANFEEAKKMMKLRKYLDEEQKKMNQEAALLLEFQANIRPSLSQVFSSIPGPELEFACMTDEKCEETSVDTNPVKSNIQQINETSKELQFAGTAVRENESIQNRDLVDTETSNGQQNVVISEHIEEERQPNNVLKVKRDVAHISEINIVNERKTGLAEVKEGSVEDDFFNRADNLPESEYSFNDLFYFSEEEKFDANFLRLDFSDFLKRYLAAEKQTKKMYLLNCNEYEENIMKEVSQKYGNFEIINYHKNGHLNVSTTKNIVKDVSLDDEINLPLNVPNTLIAESSQVDEPSDRYSFELSSDYDERLEEAMSKTSRQQIMEIILGCGMTESSTKIDYCINPNIEIDTTEDNLDETENPMKRTYIEVESSENNNMDDATPNKLRKISECDQISSTTLEIEDSSNLNSITPARSKYLGRARRVGLPKPKKTNVQNSPSSDKSIENYEQNTPDFQPPNGKVKNTPRPKFQQHYSSSDLYKPKLHYLSRRNNIS